MDFLNTLQSNTNKQSLTENGALTHTSTLDPLLDFFSRAGAMRGREAEAFALFDKAYNVEPTMAVRCLFYLRDVRGGQGERSVFRYILSKLSDDMVSKVAKFIPEYGRWDEVPISQKTIELIQAQLKEDEKNRAAGKPVSLLAKWLPSENTSSAETRKKAKLVMDLLGLKPRQYRKQLSDLRKHINLLEQKMSQKEWANIQYDKIPSQAHKKHVKAFKRNDEERYDKFIESVQKGEKKINSATLFTYEIYDMVNNHTGDDEVANELWKALPDYTRGVNALVLADVSGSMSGRPMSISVSLALYFAERNEGPFKDYFLTFTGHSRLQKVSGNNLAQRMASIERAQWDMNTDLQSAFNAILKAAVDSSATQDQMPQVLYIISDMEFDEATERNDETNLETAERKFTEAGYKLPHVVFWNVNARGDQSPATMHDSRVTLISGSSQSTFQYAVAGKTPIESMTEILNSERYAQIKL